MKNPIGFLFSTETKGEGYVPNRNILNYAIGLAGQNATYSYVANWLRYFCINILHVSEVKVGTIFFFSYIWDAINDPVVGAYIDKKKHKPYNKLRPYLVSFPPVIGALSMMMFFKVPFNETGKIVYILCCYFVWDFFYTFQDVGLWGLIALSSPHSEERSRVAQWVSIGAGCGAGIAGIFQMARNMLNGFGMADTQVFILFGVIFGLCGELLSMRAHKMNELVESGDPPEESIFKSLSIVRFNPTLLLISLARLSQGFSPKVQNAYFFENAFTFTKNGKNFEFLYGILTSIPGAIAVLFANKIAKKVGGMKNLLILSQLAAVVFRVISYFVGYDSWSKYLIMCALISLVNLPGSLMDIAHRSLTSDSIDEVELKTGVRSEGVSFAMQNFTTKMAQGVSTLIESFLLKTFSYNRFAGEQHVKQNSRFIKMQWPMFMLGPAVGSILYLIVITFVRDDKGHRDDVERQLKARKAAFAATRGGKETSTLENDDSVSFENS